MVGSVLAIHSLVSHPALVQDLLGRPCLHDGPSPAGVYQTDRNLQIVHQLLAEEETNGREAVPGQVVPGGLGPGRPEVQDLLLWDLEYK